MRKVSRVAAWLLFFTIAILSVVPPMWRPITDAPHNVEHFAIFAATGLAFSLGYRFRPLYQAIGLVAFAGAVEFAQYWIPGRHERVSDLTVDAIGACVGIAAAWLLVRATRRVGWFA
jgi:VanZ family protein